MSEQQVFAKCAWRLIPFMGLLLLVNSIDRTNVGFAALTMNKDLGFSPTVFGLGAVFSLLAMPCFKCLQTCSFNVSEHVVGFSAFWPCGAFCRL